MVIINWINEVMVNVFSVGLIITMANIIIIDFSSSDDRYNIRVLYRYVCVAIIMIKSIVIVMMITAFIVYILTLI